MESAVKTLAIILNILFPGVGSFVIGAIGQGIGQITIFGIGFIFTLVTFGFGGVIGIPMMLGAWIWGLITAIGAQSQPIQVNVIHTQEQRRLD